jgi:hypothetical protein
MSSGRTWSRRLVRSALVAIAALVGATFASASSEAVPTKLTLDGVGGAIPGMTEAKVESLWGFPLRIEVLAGSKCGIASLRGYDQHALFERGRLRSVWFRRGGSTGRGIRPGSTRVQLLKAYPRGLRSEPNHYTPGARDYSCSVRESRAGSSGSTSRRRGVSSRSRSEIRPCTTSRGARRRSRRRDSNPRPSDYKSDALPAELLRRAPHVSDSVRFVV